MKTRPDEEKFAKEYIKNGNNATQAAKDVYGITNDNYAKVKGHRKLKSKNVQKVVKSIADQIPDSLLVKVHNEGLHASKKVFKNNNESGEIEEVSEEADYPTRHKYLDTAYKVKGTYAPEKTENTTEVNIVNAEQLLLAKEYEEKLKKKL